MFAALTSREERLIPIQQYRAELIASANACQGDPEDLEEILAQINACLHTCQIIDFVHAATIYGSLMRADQFSCYLLSAWPYMPTMSGLHKALVTIREKRGAAGTNARG